jgi:hypothetical protein
VLLGERDDSTGSLDAKAGEMLVGEFLSANPAFSVHNHAVSQNASAHDNPLTRHLAGDPFNVRAISPIDVFHVSLGEGRGHYSIFSADAMAQVTLTNVHFPLAQNPIRYGNVRL